MDENRLISVIVPIYNVEKYLDRCLTSIINQSYKHLEIILVDDGSIDNSGVICDKYKGLDDRVIVIHQKNEGQSLARRRALDIAKGDYITFVDSDDIINIDLFKILMQSLVNNNTDLSICSYIKFNDINENEIIELSRINNQTNKTKIVCVDNQYALNQCLQTKKYTVSLWEKLYKKEILKNIGFPQGSEMEDWAVIVDTMIKCKKVALVDQKLYYYYQRINSTMHGAFKDKDLLLDNIFIRNLNMVDTYFPMLHNQAKTNITSNYFYVLDKMIKSNAMKKYKNEFDTIVNKLQNEKDFILFKSKHRLIRKLFYILLIIDIRIYIYLIKIIS